MLSSAQVGSHRPLVLELWNGLFLGQFLLPQGCKRTMAGTQRDSLCWEVVWTHYGEVVYCKVFIFLSLSCVPGPVLSTTVTRHNLALRELTVQE